MGLFRWRRTGQESQQPAPTPGPDGGLAQFLEEAKALLGVVSEDEAEGFYFQIHRGKLIRLKNPTRERVLEFLRLARIHAPSWADQLLKFSATKDEEQPTLLVWRRRLDVPEGYFTLEELLQEEGIDLSSI